jgi:hypothetical protein
LLVCSLLERNLWERWPPTVAAYRMCESIKSNGRLK